MICKLASLSKVLTLICFNQVSFLNLSVISLHVIILYDEKMTEQGFEQITVLCAIAYIIEEIKFNSTI